MAISVWSLGQTTHVCWLPALGWGSARKWSNSGTTGTPSMTMRLRSGPTTKERKPGTRRSSSPPLSRMLMEPSFFFCTVIDFVSPAPWILILTSSPLQEMVIFCSPSSKVLVSPLFMSDGVTVTVDPAHATPAMRRTAPRYPSRLMDFFLLFVFGTRGAGGGFGEGCYKLSVVSAVQISRG